MELMQSDRIMPVIGVRKRRWKRRRRRKGEQEPPKEQCQIQVQCAGLGWQKVFA